MARAHYCFANGKRKRKEFSSNCHIIPELERWKTLFMDIVNCMCSEKCAVLFIGFREELEYVDMLERGIRDFTHLIVSARGLFIPKMQRTLQACRLSKPSKPEEERMLNCCESNEVSGLWEFPDEEKTICIWIIFSKK